MIDSNYDIDYSHEDTCPLEIFEIGMDRQVSHYRHVSKDSTVLNLGAGTKEISWAVSLDLPEWDANHMQIPYEDGSVDAILAFHFLEHVENIWFVLSQCQRVLRPGGTLNIVVPYGMSDCAIQDLSHVHRFNEDTWKNTFSNPYYYRHDAAYGWEWEIGFNMIMGLVHRNLALVTQLIRR